MLAFLAVESHKSYSREALLGLLWPDLPTSAAQNNLRVIWSFLRRLLGEENSSEEAFLISTRLELRFNPDSDHWLDMTVFQQLLEDCRNHQHKDRLNCNACAERLAQAASLVRGEFLAGFSLGDCPAFDEWLFIQRERLHLQLTDLLGELASYHELQGSLDEAERYVRRLLETDPLREHAQRQLMRLQFQAGRRSAALAQFENFRRLLADELGVSPAIETISLVEQIRAGATIGAVTPRHNLPASTSQYFGRRQEIAEIQELLTGEKGRLLTLTGPGGVGKTRLALQIAYGLVDQFPDGIWLVELAALKDPLAITSAVGLVLNLPQQRGQALIESLSDFLREKSLLLILDNCEHLVEACAQLVKTLRETASQIDILATSRAALRLGDERVVRLQPLLSPKSGSLEAITAADLLQYESVQLFINRAAKSLLNFTLSDTNAPAVAKICHHLDGIPLAIELAAAQTGVMPVEAIAKRLDQRFRWLKSRSTNPLPRHQTLLYLFNWSHELLGEQEAALFRRLSVFAGGWTLDAVIAICGNGERCVDVLTGLVDQSLVVFGYDTAGMRYRMHETIQQYASQQLHASDEESVIQARHAQYYARTIRMAVENVKQEPLLARLESLELELENLRTALEWAVNHDCDLALELAVDLGKHLRFWELRGHHDEGRRWLKRILERDPDEVASARAGVLLVAAELSSAICDFEYGQYCATNSRQICSRLGDRQGEVDALLISAELAIYQGEYAQLFEQVQEAMMIAEELDYKPGLAKGGRLLGEIANHRGEYDRAIHNLIPSVALWRQLNNDYELAFTLNTLAAAMMNKGEHAEASEVLRETVAINRNLGYRRGVALALHNLAEAAIYLGNYAYARELTSESLRIRRELGLRRGYAFSLENFALLAAHENQWSRAVQLFASAQALREQISSPVYPFNQEDQAESLATAHSILGEVRFNLDWSKGWALTTEQAVELALS